MWRINSSKTKHIALHFAMTWYTNLEFLLLLRPANEVWGKVISLQASVCPQGGVPDQVHPPEEQTPPGADTPWEQTPPRTRYSPPAQTPPGTRYTPQSRHPQPGTPPSPWSRHPPRTRYSPSPRSRHPPPPQSRHPPPGSRHPPPEAETPPPHRACWETRSTRGRSASYWNAILCKLLSASAFFWNGVRNV